MRRGRWVWLIVGIVLMPVTIPVGAASNFASPTFSTTWQAGENLTPNFWGPLANARDGQQEQYAEASGGQRLVQYFDKGRMELTNGTQTNGLLATELVKGQIQTGNATFQAKTSPSIPIAGDPTNAGPTYAQVGGSTALTSATSSAPHVDIRQALTMSGAPGPFIFPASDPLATIGAYDAPTSHNVATAFASFRDTVGLAAIGYAIVEPFWTNISVGGKATNVLVQVFERRVLTYTPSNPVPFKVEFGNIGQHYYQWRYGSNAAPLPPPVVTDDPAQAAMQFLPQGASVTSARVVDLDGSGSVAALIVAEVSTTGPGHSQIALFIVKQGSAWQLAYRTPPDEYAMVSIDAIPKSDAHPAFVIANWHLCGANCNSGGHTIIRWDGGGKTAIALDGQDDRGNLTADATTGAVKLAGPVYRSQDPRCCPAYQYTEMWSWKGTALHLDTFTIFNISGSSAGPPPTWLTGLGPSLFLSLVPLTAGPPTPASLVPLFAGQVQVRDLNGQTCTAEGGALAAAFAAFPSHSVYGLWQDSDHYRAVVGTASGGIGKTPATQVGSCTLGGDGVDGYTLTLVGATGGDWQITGIEAVPNAYKAAPDTAIVVPPV